MGKKAGEKEVWGEEDREEKSEEKKVGKKKVREKIEQQGSKAIIDKTRLDKKEVWQNLN